jgi:hypothetical protein
MNASVRRKPSFGEREVGMFAKRVVQRAHQEIAGPADAVAREHAPGTVRAVRGRREADEQQPRAWIAEAWNGASPVGVVAKRATLLASDARAVRAQAGTAIAGHDRVAYERQGSCHGCVDFKVQ